jgi:hypothetical protein
VRGDLTEMILVRRASPHRAIQKTDKHDADPAVADALSATTWANLEIQPEVRLLGDVITSSTRAFLVITSSTRAFLVGLTGIGKTMLIYAMVGGMASGKGFLHWTSDRPSRWLVIDGEMPSSLIKSRAADMLRRSGGDSVPPHNVLIYARDREDVFAKEFPRLGKIAPLNTEVGHNFVVDLIAAVGPIDGIAFDNVMSLAPGDQKDEESWAGCIPLVEYLSRQGIAQLWGDHIGLNTGRQYGSSVKSWRFDSVAVITPLTDADRPVDHLAFKISFDIPGKARRRTPDNWQDFAPRIIRLVDDAWSGEALVVGGRRNPASDEARLADKPALLLREIRKALALHGREQMPEEGSSECLAVARSRVRERLISAGFYPDHQLCTALQDKGGQVSPTKVGLTAESNALITLKRRQIIGFNRFLVWQP